MSIYTGFTLINIVAGKGGTSRLLRPDISIAKKALPRPGDPLRSSAAAAVNAAAGG
jgi:hypothetical protein